MSFLANLAALTREVREMLIALRDLAREMREPSAPRPHPLDASPLPTMAEVSKSAAEEGAAWADMLKQFDELAPPLAPAASSTPADTEVANIPAP